MAFSSTGLNDIFDASGLYAEATAEIATIMLILGIDIIEINSITIDNIIEKIKIIYPYVKSSSQQITNGQDDVSVQSAYSRVLMTESMSLIRRIRRSWFNMEFAREVAEQNV